MRIKNIRPSQRKQGRVLVQLEDDSILRLSQEELLRFGLFEGMELDPESLACELAAVRTKSTAVGMIGRRALSKKELEQRLTKKGASEENAREAADWLEEIGAVDDAAYAAMVVRHYGGKGYGPARVREELHRKGVPRELWDEALQEMPPSADVLDRLIQKKCSGDLSDPKELKRVSDGLLRRGFGWGEVKAALRRYAEIGED